MRKLPREGGLDSTGARTHVEPHTNCCCCCDSPWTCRRGMPHHARVGTASAATRLAALPGLAVRGAPRRRLAAAREAWRGSVPARWPSELVAFGVCKSASRVERGRNRVHCDEREQLHKSTRANSELCSEARARADDVAPRRFLHIMPSGPADTLSKGAGAFPTVSVHQDIIRALESCSIVLLNVDMLCDWRSCGLSVGLW